MVETVAKILASAPRLIRAAATSIIAMTHRHPTLAMTPLHVLSASHSGWLMGIVISTEDTTQLFAIGTVATVVSKRVVWDTIANTIAALQSRITSVGIQITTTRFLSILAVWCQTRRTYKMAIATSTQRETTIPPVVRGTGAIVVTRPVLMVYLIVQHRVRAPSYVAIPTHPPSTSRTTIAKWTSRSTWPMPTATTTAGTTPPFAVGMVATAASSHALNQWLRRSSCTLVATMGTIVEIQLPVEYPV